jgi:hypothetical protein
MIRVNFNKDSFIDCEQVRVGAVYCFMKNPLVPVKPLNVTVDYLHHPSGNMSMYTEIDNIDTIEGVLDNDNE